MFENLGHFFKRMVKTEQQKELGSKDAAKERLHLVLMQDRANVSADFLELMKQEIIDVIKKYIVVDEDTIDVRLTNQANEDGTTGAPSLYANIPIVNIKNDIKSEKIEETAEIIEEASKIVQEQAANNENINKQEIDEKVSTDIPKEEKREEEKEEEAEVEVEKTVEEVKENDEEIDDVPTFDELLKQSEEENSKENANKEETEKKTKKKTKKKSKVKNKTEEE